MPVAEIDQDSPKSLMSNWMTEINKIPVDRITKEEPSGKTAPVERPAELAPADKPALVNNPPVEKGSQTAPKPAGDDKAGASDTQEDKTPPTHKPEPIKAAEDKDDDYLTAPQPKDKKGWEKWTANRQKKETQLKKDIQERETKLAELQSRLTEVEAKATSFEPDPKIKAQIERLEAENKEMTETIMRLNVTEHSKFKSHYEGQLNAVIARAKQRVGPEKAEQIEKVLKIQDPEYRQFKVDEFLQDIDSDTVRGRLNAVLEDYDKVMQDKESEITRIREHNATLEAQETATASANAEKTKALREQVYNQTVKELTDPEKGFAPFQTRDGDDAWNQGVHKRVEAAKGLLSGQNLKPEIIARAAFYAVAVPSLIESMTASVKAWSEKEAGYEAKIAELVAAQPRGGGTATAKTDPGVQINRDTKPHQLARGWADSMAEAMKGVGQ